MTINYIHPNLVEEVKELDKIVFTDRNEYTEDKEVILDRLEVFPEGCYGFFENKKLIGYATSERWSKHHKTNLNEKASKKHDKGGTILYISVICVHPNTQGKRVRSELMEKLIALARGLKLKSIYLRTTHAQKFFEKFGFRLIKHFSDENNVHDTMELILQ